MLSSRLGCKAHRRVCALSLRSDHRGYLAEGCYCFAKGDSDGQGNEAISSSGSGVEYAPPADTEHQSTAPKVEAPTVLSRRHFGYTAFAASAAALLAGCSKHEPAAEAASSQPALSPELNVVQSSKGPVMTTLEEFYKIGPGPSSSHTMGPMRITYYFFQRISKLPEDQLKRATALKVHLYGSLSATGKGHDDRHLRRLVGAPQPAPEFLDFWLQIHEAQSYTRSHYPRSDLKDIVFMLPRRLCHRTR